MAEHTTLDTHRFLYNRWAARRTAAFMMIVLYVVLIWIILGQGSSLNSWLEFFVIGSAAAFALVFIVISRHPITRLLVCPEGISAPYGILRQIAWHEIEAARYIPKRPLLLAPREWIHLQLKPNVSNLSRLPLPPLFDKWLARTGVWIPMHLLRAPSGEILSSVERFMTVIETDLEPELLGEKQMKEFL